MDDKDKLQLLETLISLLPGHVYWKNKEGAYLGCNDGQAHTLGYASGKDIVGKTDYDLIASNEADNVCALDQAVIKNKRPYEAEETVTLSAGKQSVFLSKKVPLFDKNNEAIGVVGISFDITDRKSLVGAKEAKEKAETESRAKTQFLAVVSHELRAPLTGIISTASMLAEGVITSEEEIKQTGKIMLDSAAYLLSNINSILDFAKLEAEKFELTPTPFDLKALIEETVTMLTAAAKSKGLELLITYPPNISHNIYSDSRAVRQILVNLINNAIKFTDKGHVAINVRCVKETAQNVKLEIAIEDTGMGIPPGKFDFIFDRFSQIEDKYVRKSSRSGTGLGLSITKRLVDLLNGEIRVTSTEGKGSTFYVTIEFPLQSAATQKMPWAPYAASVKVLVVADNLQGEILCKHLGSSKCEIAARDKALGILITAQQIGDPFDIVVMDEESNNLLPVELLYQINGQKNLKRVMPVVLLSHGTTNAQDSAAKQGFFKTIIKPVQPIAFQTELTSAWEKWFELHQEPKSTSIKHDFHLKVLLVEDELLEQYAHKNMLASLGCKVELADGKDKVLEMLTADANYEIIFVDIDLNHIDGKEIIVAMRRCSAVMKTPIIAITGYTRKHEVEACLNAGATEVVRKPITAKILDELLGRYKNLS